MGDELLVPTQISDAISNIDWDKVLQEGAESLAKSFGAAAGAAVGGPLGQIAAGILISFFGGGGNPDLAIQREIINRLTRIETKLDSFMKFVSVELPTIMAKIFDDALLKQMNIELNSYTTSADSILEIVNGKGTLDDVDKITLMNVTLRFSEVGIRLLTNGKEYALGGLHAFSMAYTLYSKIIQFDKSYGNGLIAMSKAYSELLKPMIDSSTGTAETVSFVPVGLRLSQELNAALPYKDSIIGEYPMGVNVVSEGDPMGPWIFTSTVTYTRFWVDQAGNLQYTPNVRRVDFPGVSLAGQDVPDLCPWFDTPVAGDQSKVNEHAALAYEKAKTLYSTITRHPGRIEYIDSSISIVEKFLEASVKIASAAG